MQNTLPYLNESLEALKWQVFLKEILLLYQKLYVKIHLFYI